tara:strand:+ start:151 stop:387 length:237 start_codon:yes stop_codon:yes gene_type:complete
MGDFRKLYDKNFQANPQDIHWNGWTNQTSDINDFLKEIDEGYLTANEFTRYNQLLEIHKDKLKNNEVWELVKKENKNG